MPDIKLYHLPGACSRVTMTALEHVGADYEDEIVNLMKGQQHSPEYRAVNPKGKIPALIVEGELLAENSAILWWLDRTFPDAGLLPAGDSWEKTQQLSDLFNISSAWHPSVRANMMPIRWTTGDPEPVRERGKQLVQPIFEQFNARLEGQDWWYGDNWSIIDTYAYWNYTTAEKGQFNLSSFKNIAGHRERVEAQLSFKRALAREKAGLEKIGGLPNVG